MLRYTGRCQGWHYRIVTKTLPLLLLIPPLPLLLLPLLLAKPTRLLLPLPPGLAPAPPPRAAAPAIIRSRSWVLSRSCTFTYSSEWGQSGQWLSE